MINSIFNDGANWQAQAVAAYIVWHYDIDADCKQDINDPILARWYNCREQGYVISLRVSGKQLNIAFFEHRNSDAICAVKWQQVSINPLTIDTAKFGDVYKDKYDTSHDVGYGDIVGMGKWICEQLAYFASAYKNPVDGK